MKDMFIVTKEGSLINTEVDVFSSLEEAKEFIKKDMIENGTSMEKATEMCGGCWKSWDTKHQDIEWEIHQKF